MINKKTAKLLETSAVIGALTGNADEELLNNLKNFALNTGMAFQIQDDLLDITADESELGKKIGGDVLERKKTFLLLKAIETISNDIDKKLITDIAYNNEFEIDDEKISEVRQIYTDYGIIESARSEIAAYTKKAEHYLYNIKNEESRELLKWFSGMLMDRKF